MDWKTGFNRLILIPKEDLIMIWFQKMENIVRHQRKTERLQRTEFQYQLCSECWEERFKVIYCICFEH
jgi:hypothetical protein